MWLQVFLLNTNNFQTDLFDPYMKPKQVLPLWVREDLGVKKGSSKLPRSLEMGPHNQIEFNFIPSKPLSCGGGGIGREHV